MEYGVPLERVESLSSDMSTQADTALIRPQKAEGGTGSVHLGFEFPYVESLNAGSRAFEAFVRPSPIAVAGRPKSYGFDMRSCSFHLTIIPYQDAPLEDAPTEIFVPDYFFHDAEPEIVVSSGRWAVRRREQVLLWWHGGPEEQALSISSSYRRDGLVGTMDDDVEGCYYPNQYPKCVIL
jgi:Glycoside hydrolase family 5 C-terminal domain